MAAPTDMVMSSPPFLSERDFQASQVNDAFLRPQNLSTVAGFPVLTLEKKLNPALIEHLLAEFNGFDIKRFLEETRMDYVLVPNHWISRMSPDPMITLEPVFENQARTLYRVSIRLTPD